MDRYLIKYTTNAEQILFLTREEYFDLIDTIENKNAKIWRNKDDTVVVVISIVASIAIISEKSAREEEKRRIDEYIKLFPYLNPTKVIEPPIVALYAAFPVDRTDDSHKYEYTPPTWILDKEINKKNK